jgi:dUTP pyrophosphatase
MIKYFLDDEAIKAECYFNQPRKGDAGFDIYAKHDQYLRSRGVNELMTGLYLEFPDTAVGIIKDRSSLAARGITVMGGVIDSSYRGEIGVFLYNANDNYHRISAGERIAQIVFTYLHDETWGHTLEVESLRDLSDTPRGNGAKGSTGK